MRFITLILPIILVSCASTSSSEKLKSATVVRVERGYRSSDINYARPTMSALQFGMIGSRIGTGTAAHVVGAAVGALAGGGLSYMSARKDARGAYTSVTLRLDEDNSKATVGATRVKPMPMPGQRVWVRCDSAGIPYEIVPHQKKPPYQPTLSPTAQR